VKYVIHEEKHKHGGRGRENESGGREEKGKKGIRRSYEGESQV